MVLERRGVLADFAIPSDVGGWTELAKESRVEDKNLHNFGNLKSGFQITQQQFELLRAIWPYLRKRETFKTLSGIPPEFWGKAETLVQSSPLCRNICE